MAVRLRVRDRVYLTATQSDKFKTGCFSVHFLRPLRRQEAAQNALIPGVLLGGTTSCPDVRSISIRLDTMYGASVGALARKKGEVQAVGLYADYVEDALVGEPVFVPVTRFVAELLFCPLTEQGGFRREIYENERVNLINTMRSTLNSKQTYANLQLLKAMFADEPYGIPAHGEEADLEGLDAVRLFAQYQRLLAEAPVEIVYLGRAAPEEAAAVFREMLSALPSGAGSMVPQTAPGKAGPLRQLEQRMPLAQSKLAIGCRCPAARAPQELAEMLCFCALFGGSYNSRLFLNVREAKSLCYYINSVYDKYKGLLRINSGIAADHHAQVREEIYRQLSDCAEGRFTEQELATAKRLLSAQLRSDQDNPSRLDEFYLGQAVLGRQEPLERLIEAVDLVDAAAVRRAAAGVCPDTEFFLKGVGE